MSGQDIVVGEAGDVTVSVYSDGTIAIIPDGDFVLLSIVNAARLAVLLDEAIGLAKGGVKLDKDMD